MGKLVIEKVLQLMALAIKKAATMFSITTNSIWFLVLVNNTITEKPMAALQIVFLAIKDFVRI